MAIYYVRKERNGFLSIEAELTIGGIKQRSGRFMAKDKAELRKQAQNVALMVKAQRIALKRGGLAQVNSGEETS